MFNRPLPPRTITTSAESSSRAVNSPTSLEKTWGVDKQEQWLTLRKIAIQEGVQLIKNDENYPLAKLYDFLIEKRFDIAEAMATNNNVSKFIKMNRTVFCSTKIFPASKNLPKTALTYADFYDYLTELYSQNFPTPLNYTLHSRAFAAMEDGMCKGVSEVAISYNTGEHRLEYTTIHFLNFTPTDEDPYTCSLTPRPEDAYELYYITHTPDENIPQIWQIVESLYHSINQTSDQSEKINIIKQICWHLSHAMTQVRGSAAINEMLLEILLIKNNISYDFSNLAKDKAPVDLIALFSTSPEQFSKRFVVNPEIESTLSAAQAASVNKPR